MTYGFQTNRYFQGLPDDDKVVDLSLMRLTDLYSMLLPTFICKGKESCGQFCSTVWGQDSQARVDRCINSLIKRAAK